MLERKASPQSEELQMVISDIETFVQRATDAAMSLYVLSDATRGADQSSRDLANALFAFNAVLSYLKSYWTTTDIPVTTPEKCYLLSCILKNNFGGRLLPGLESTIEQIRQSVDSDERVKGKTREESSASVQFPKTGLQQILETHTLLIADQAIKEREMVLSQRTATNHETSDCLCLHVAVESTDLFNAPGCLNLSTKQECSKSTNTAPPSDSSSRFCTSSGTILPQHKPRSLTLPHDLAPMTYKEIQHQRQAVMAAETRRNNANTEDTPQDAPASTPEPAPITKSDKDTATDVNNVLERLKELLNRPIGPTPAVVANGAEPANGEKTLSNPWTTFVSRNEAQHHEAYILRPHVETFGGNVVWTSKIEPLYLDEAAMRVHVMKLGSGYSIIDAVGELLPEQLVLVQRQAKSRNGRLACVQYSAPADMVTTMGTFKIKSVIFIIVTSAEDSDAPATRKVETKAPNVKAFSFPYTSTRGFPPPRNSNNEKPGSSGFTPSLTQNPQSSTSLPQSKEPTSASTLSGSLSNGLTASWRPVGSLLKNGEQGDVSYWDTYNRDGSQERFMTITAEELPSLEELRVRDYAAGRTKPWTPSRNEKPCDGHYVNLKAPENVSTAFKPTNRAPTSVFCPNPASVSVFGSLGPKLQPVVPGHQGFFGGVQSTSSSFSLFGKPTASEPLFSGNNLGNTTNIGSGDIGFFPSKPSSMPLQVIPTEKGLSFAAPVNPSRSLFGNTTSTSPFVMTPKGPSTGVFGRTSKSEPSTDSQTFGNPQPPQSSFFGTRKESASGQSGTTSSSTSAFGNFIKSRPTAEGLAKQPKMTDKLDNTKVSDLVENQNEVLPSTSPAPTPAIESATSRPSTRTEQSDAPSTNGSELE